MASGPWLAGLCLACGQAPPGPPGDDAPQVQVQTLADRIGDPESMSPEDIKLQRGALAERLVTDPDPRVRADIAAALGYTARDVDSIPALAGALEKERDPAVQRRLIAVLVSFSRADAVDAVVGFALGSVDPGLVPDLHSALLGADPAMVEAALAGRASGQGAAVTELRRALCVAAPGSTWCAG